METSTNLKLWEREDKRVRKIEIYRKGEIKEGTQRSVRKTTKLTQASTYPKWQAAFRDRRLVD